MIQEKGVILEDDPLLAGSHQPGFVGSHNRLDPISETELGEEMGYMALHGRLGDE
jgi:hypothetical protein